MVKVVHARFEKKTEWCKTQPNSKRDDIDLLKEDNVPLLHWPIARVVCTKPGKDEIVPLP